MAVGDLIPPSFLLRRLGTTIITAASSTFATTEVSLGTVTAVVEAGQKYALVADNLKFSASAVASPSTEVTLARIREDSLTGTEVGANQVGILTASTAGFGLRVYTEWTAPSSGSKTFHLTAVRASGANNHVLRGATTSPCFVYVDLILS